MLIDNKNELEKDQYTSVYQYLRAKLVENGDFNFVTGYFTITAIAALLDKFPKQKNYKIILGDLFSVQPNRKNIIDIINTNHKIVDVLNINEVCQRAVEFLKHENVKVKTVDKNFCHAKTYIHKNPIPKNKESNFYIVGSSNFTDAGLGIRHSANVELNKLISGLDASFVQAQLWFDLLWNSETTKSTIVTEQKIEMDCKEFLIELISDFYEKYTPEILYYKTLYELFKSDLEKFDLDISAQRDIVHLKDTVIFHKLFNFQQKGVLSLIRMMKKFNGAILADAVGLGKTWSALAVMKYFELQGYKVLVLCPKKLANNWQRYLKDRHSVFEADKFDYFVRYHSDLFGRRMDKDGMSLSNFKRFQKLLIVIDESHNLRNDISGRYKFLVEQLYFKSETRDVKTLMLSATPINNKLLDVRNQFKLIAKGNDDGFKDTEGIEIKSLERKFGDAQKYFNKWQFQENRKISELRAQIPDEIFNLIDSTVVARTRQLIKKYLNENLHFPEVAEPENVPGDVMEIGNLKTVEDILSAIEQIGMTAYKPAFYMKEVKAKDATEDDRQRQKTLAKLMYILLVKRMESSWWAFYKTANSIYEYHKFVLKAVTEFKKKTAIGDYDETHDVELLELDEVFEEMEFQGEEEIGKKKRIHLSQIIRLDEFEKHLTIDVKNFKSLIDNLEIVHQKLETEKQNKPGDKTADKKLEQLISIIREKRKKDKHRKIIIFTVFRDTAKYLYDQLKLRSFDRMALVTGSENQCTYVIHGRKTEDDFEPLLERFAPETKVFREKEWEHLYDKHNITPPKTFDQWKNIIEKYDSDTFRILEEPVEILIATDCLSEGQNLQDADCLINYDIHWNPVRLIQRFGRIDRIGSPYKKIYGVNFWPAKNVDDYLRLKNRVEARMAAGALIGTETQTLSKNFDEMLDDRDKIISKQAEKMFKQLEIGWGDIEAESESLGFNDLSFEQFRQELFELMGSKRELLEQIPNGVYSGFSSLLETKLHAFSPGLLGLIGFPRKEENATNHSYKHLEMFYISTDKKFQILNNMEVLVFLRDHKMAPRFVPPEIEKPSPEKIEELKGLIEEWMSRKFAKEDFDLVKQLADGGTTEGLNADEIPAERYSLDNYDLITWFVVSKNKRFL